MELFINVEAVEDRHVFERGRWKEIVKQGALAQTGKEKWQRKVWPKDFFALKKSTDLCYIC